MVSDATISEDIVLIRATLLLIDMASSVSTAAAGQPLTPPQINVPPIVAPNGSGDSDACKQSNPDAKRCGPVFHQPGATLESLLAHPESLSWFDLYMLSSLLLKNHRPDEAAKWFYVGEIRAAAHSSCDHFRPGDAEPALNASVMSTLRPSILASFAQNPDGLMGAINTALAWDEAYPEPYLSNDKCQPHLARARSSIAKFSDYVNTHREELARLSGAPGRASGRR